MGAGGGAVEGGGGEGGGGGGGEGGGGGLEQWSNPCHVTQGVLRNQEQAKE